MSNEWDEQRTGGSQGPGPEFDEGRSSSQGQYPQQGPYSESPYSQQPQNQHHSFKEPGQQPPPGEQPYQGQQPYPEQQPYSGQQVPPEHYWSQSPPVSAVPQRRSSALGISGLVIVVVATAALVAASWALGAGLADYFLDLAETGFPRDPDELMNDPRTMAYAESSVGPLVAALLAGFVGLIGWIISIVATATRRGRTFGIVGIILGVLSLPLAYLTFTWVAGPYLA